jgi:hypothetical protein
VRCVCRHKEMQIIYALNIRIYIYIHGVHATAAKLIFKQKIKRKNKNTLLLSLFFKQKIINNKIKQKAKKPTCQDLSPIVLASKY